MTERKAIMGFTSIPKWVWWNAGGCVIEVIRTGHYPTTIMGKMPNDKVIEIDINELEHTR
jgi:hypothetical protein